MTTPTSDGISHLDAPIEARRLETVDDLIHHLLSNDAIGDEVIAAGVILERLVKENAAHDEVLIKAGRTGGHGRLNAHDHLELWGLDGQHAKLELDR